MSVVDKLTVHHSSYKTYLVKQDASIIRVNVYFKAGYIVGKEGLRWVLTWPHCPAGSGCARKAVLNTALIPKCRKKKSCGMTDWQYLIQIENDTWTIVTSLLTCMVTTYISIMFSPSLL